MGNLRWTVLFAVAFIVGATIRAATGHNDSALVLSVLAVAIAVLSHHEK